MKTNDIIFSLFTLIIINSGVKKILLVVLVIIAVLDIGLFHVAIYAIVTTEEQPLAFVTKYIFVLSLHFLAFLFNMYTYWR